MRLDLSLYRNGVKPKVESYMKRHPEAKDHDLISILALSCSCHCVAVAYFISEVRGEMTPYTKAWLDKHQKTFYKIDEVVG